MRCEDWCSLLERYRRSVRAYSEAADSLTAVPGAQFNQLWHRAERARMEVGLSRTALLNHEQDHACLTNDIADKQEAVLLEESEELVLGDQGQPGG